MHRSTKFKTFPDLLIFHMKKFQLVNWVPTKLGAWDPRKQEIGNHFLLWGPAHDNRNPGQSA